MITQNLKPLSELSEIDAEIYQLKQKLVALDNGDQQKALFSKVLALEKVNEQKLQKLLTEQKKLEDTRATLSDKKEKANKTLYSGNITNPKELSDLKEAEESFERRISELDMPLLEVMESIESVNKTAEDIKSKLNSVKKSYQKIAAQYKADNERLLAKIAELTLISKEQRGNIDDATLLSRYDGICKKGHGIGVTVITPLSDSCSVCKTAISQNILSKVKEANEIIFCENCGRIIYLEEEN